MINKDSEKIQKLQRENLINSVKEMEDTLKSSISKKNKSEDEISKEETLESRIRYFKCTYGITNEEMEN